MNESEKLLYLLQYTTGNAKKTIECCVVMDPSNGYMAARKFLKSALVIRIQINEFSKETTFGQTDSIPQQYIGPKK